MKIYALLSYWDEKPEHLTRCVDSLEGFYDYLIAVDGSYSTFDPARYYSAADQCRAIFYAGSSPVDLIDSHADWPSEVAKRAAMFEYGREAGATSDDWFLIIDADMALAEFTPDARALLTATDLNVAEVRWNDVQIDGVIHNVAQFRSMFRALPGLTVERTHWLYVTPDEAHAHGRRFLWHTPDGHISQEPVLDLTNHVTLNHFNSQRDPDRKARARDYYLDRDARQLESAGDWR